MLGLMKLLNIDYALSIICVGTLIIGIGIDDGIHMLLRYKQTGDLKTTITSSGRSVVLTSLTTSIGFASLLFANQETLYILGLPAVIGIFACLVSTLMIIPAIVKLAGNNMF